MKRSAFRIGGSKQFVGLSALFAVATGCYGTPAKNPGSGGDGGGNVGGRGGVSVAAASGAGGTGLGGRGGVSGGSGNAIGGRAGSAGQTASGGVSGSGVFPEGSAGAGGSALGAQGGRADGNLSGAAGAGGTAGATGTGGGAAGTGRGGSTGIGGSSAKGGAPGNGGAPGSGGSSGNGGAPSMPCGATCESFQYCSGGGRCLPQYRSTTILPIAPAAMLDQPVVHEMPAALVASNGDLFLQVRVHGQIVLGNTPGGTLGGINEGADFIIAARYSSSGVLQWARDMTGLMGDNAYLFGPVALASGDDLVVAFVRDDPPPPPPGRITAQYRLARIDGGNPTIKWEASYGVNGPSAYYVVPRAARNDFITMGFGPDMTFCCSPIVQVNGSGTSVNIIGSVYSYNGGAMTGRDGSTLWMYGAWGGSGLRFNPWSSMTWNVPSNPNQFGQYDAFIVGAKDDGTTLGPWITQGDEGPGLNGFALASDGQPIFSMAGSAPTRINGQDLLVGEGRVLAKLDATTGTIVWKTDIVDRPAIAVTGDQGVAAVELGTDAPPRLTLFSANDGQVRSSLTVPGMVYRIVAGPTDLFLVGTTNGSADFNPGAATDIQGGSTPGVFITRYSF
jgi:hypothetical protein